MVWKQNDSYSTFAVLRGSQEQHDTLLLFQSECFQIPGGRRRNFFRRHCVCQWGGVSGFRRVVDELKQTKKALYEQKCLDLEASSRAWRCCDCEHR